MLLIVTGWYRGNEIFNYLIIWFIIKNNITGEIIETNRKKVGAMIGDFVEIGCGSVLNPGTVIGKNTNIYPLSSVRGVIPQNSIYKNEKNIITRADINNIKS